ncbi:TolB-like translocation protein; signal peptide [Virgisporangium aliadipatigenens]|uniref:TolB-like translocation protein signal peptide n=1 Tax=Virgisporangium aliadipatigenens TaxID=741659 RepID=A0A8J4DTI6_9ACTN|nr:hypothetical protein [Virgisporangium aliadipatigenens]GIJ49033.1 TolB-like translocation protein; signal peptide [Virgisporangium aliadipatigenens]
MNVRILGVVAVLVLSTGGAVGYVLREHAAGAGATPDRAYPGDLASVSAAPRIVFRNTLAGAEQGRLAMVPASAPSGARALAPPSCSRSYTRGGTTICLATSGGLAPTYRVLLLDRQWRTTRELASVPGLSSRTRLSADGTLLATTAFVTGDSYNSPGQFSTRTTITRVRGDEPGVDLESFTLLVDGGVVTAADRNFWGVTFADDDRFYATAASGGRTWLVEGRLSTRRLTALRPDVECPSLSPDGTRVAFKKHGDLPAGRWRLSVLDLRTGAVVELAEPRSVDDQAEWLDDDTVLYGLGRVDDTEAGSDVWAVPADGTGAPRMVIEGAWSPSVVR